MRTRGSSPPRPRVANASSARSRRAAPAQHAVDQLGRQRRAPRRRQRRRAIQRRRQRAVREGASTLDPLEHGARERARARSPAASLRAGRRPLRGHASDVPGGMGVPGEHGRRRQALAPGQLQLGERDRARRAQATASPSGRRPSTVARARPRHAGAPSTTRGANSLQRLAVEQRASRPATDRRRARAPTPRAPAASKRSRPSVLGQQRRQRRRGVVLRRQRDARRRRSRAASRRAAPRPAPPARPTASPSCRRRRSATRAHRRHRPGVEPRLHAHDRHARLALSPRMIDHWMGAAPRSLGSSERVHVPAARAAAGRAAPAAGCGRTRRRRTRPRRARAAPPRISGVRTFSGCSTGTPSAAAATLTAGGVGACPRPAGRSGWLTTATTASRPRRRARGTAPRTRASRRRPPAGGRHQSASGPHDRRLWRSAGRRRVSPSTRSASSTTSRIARASRPARCASAGSSASGASSRAMSSCACCTSPALASRAGRAPRSSRPPRPARSAPATPPGRSSSDRRRRSLPPIVRRHVVELAIALRRDATMRGAVCSGVWSAPRRAAHRCRRRARRAARSASLARARHRGGLRPAGRRAGLERSQAGRGRRQVRPAARRVRALRELLAGVIGGRRAPTRRRRGPAARAVAAAPLLAADSTARARSSSSSGDTGRMKNPRRGRPCAARRRRHRPERSAPARAARSGPWPAPAPDRGGPSAAP